MTSSLRVAFFGNSDSAFSNRHFRALWQTRCPLVAVVDVPPDKRASTNKPVSHRAASFVELARRRNIPVFEPSSPNAPAFVDSVRALTPDLLLAVGYTYRLKPDLLAVPRLLAANFHASLLPAYRGMHPVFWALRHGEPFVGLTVHVMDPELDTGDILYQVRVRVRRADSVATAYDRIMAQSVPLVPRLLADLAAGRLVHTPQPTVGASYYSSISESDFALDLRRPARELRDWIAATPDRCFLALATHRVFLTHADVVPTLSPSRPGLWDLARTTVTFTTGVDSLRVHRARLDDGPIQPAATIFRALHLVPTADLLPPNLPP